MGKKSYYEEIVKLLQRLKQDHPTYGMGRHLSTALAEDGDLWGLSDKEILSSLEKYENELKINEDDEDIDQIIEDGKNLEKLLKRGPYDLDELEEEY